MKLSHRIISLLLACMLTFTSFTPVSASQVETETTNPAGIEIVSDFSQSFYNVIDWLIAEYQKQVEIEEQEIKAEKRLKNNEIKEMIVSINDLVNPVKSVPLYNQLDYPHIQYGCCGTVASHGCGITCLAMVASYLLDEEYTPDELAKQFGDYNTSEGSLWVLFEDSAKELGLKLQERTHDTSKVMEALANGQVVISIQDYGIFTDSGHFIVLVGLTSDGKIIVNDPNGRNYTKNETMVEGFRNGFTESQVFNAGKAYWIYEKKEVKNVEISSDSNIVKENTLVLNIN